MGGWLNCNWLAAGWTFGCMNWWTGAGAGAGDGAVKNCGCTCCGCTCCCGGCCPQAAAAAAAAAAW